MCLDRSAVCVRFCRNLNYYPVKRIMLFILYVSVVSTHTCLFISFNRSFFSVFVEETQYGLSTKMKNVYRKFCLLITQKEFEIFSGNRWEVR
jgi:hypothetical protein